MRCVGRTREKREYYCTYLDKLQHLPEIVWYTQNHNGHYWSSTAESERQKCASYFWPYNVPHNTPPPKPRAAKSFLFLTVESYTPAVLAITNSVRFIPGSVYIDNKQTVFPCKDCKKDSLRSSVMHNLLLEASWSVSDCAVQRSWYTGCKCVEINRTMDSRSIIKTKANAVVILHNDRGNVLTHLYLKLQYWKLVFSMQLA